LTAEVGNHYSTKNPSFRKKILSDLLWFQDIGGKSEQGAKKHSHMKKEEGGKGGMAVLWVKTKERCGGGMTTENLL